MKHLLGLQLWHLLKYAEFPEVIRQNGKLYLCNKVWVFDIIGDVEKLLKVSSIHKSEKKNYPKDAFHMYAENESAMKSNETVLNHLIVVPYTIETNGKVTDNFDYPLTTIEAVQNQNHTNTGGLAELRKSKIATKIMLIINMDMHERLINGQTRTIRYIHFAEGVAHEICNNFFY